MPLPPLVFRDFMGLSAGIAMVGLALGTVLPLSTLRLEAQGGSSTLIGLLMALHALGLVLSMPLSTRAVDRWAPRRVLTLAALSSAVCCAGLQQAGDAVSMGAGLCALGLSLGVVFNLVESWVNDILPEAVRGQWIAIHCTVFTLCQLSGPLLLQVLPPDQAFVWAGALLALSVPVCARLGAHRFADEQVGEVAWPWWRLLWRAPAIAWGTVLFALFDALVLSLLPYYARQHGMDAAASLLSASVVLAGDTALEWVVGTLADRVGRLRMQLVCAAVLLVSVPMLPGAVGTLWWWPLLFLMGGAAGGIYVLSLMACGQRFKGRRLLQMTSLLGACWGVASCVGPLMTGVLMTVSVAWALPGVLMVCTALLLLALFKEEAAGEAEEVLA